jgi:multiple sugar transport system ATP-binding protein
MAGIRLEGIAKTYPGGQAAVRDLELEIADGELLVLVGPSGCGKSTALRLIAGLESPTAGRIWIAGRDVTDDPPQDRDVAMVFQSYALYPHRSVRENLGFGLRMRKVRRAQIERRVEAAAESLGIAGLLDRKPRQLSGGQRQRVALGRAIVREPRAFLLDEPLSNLDAKLRIETRAEISRLHRRLGATMVYVTHDQEEAMTLGDRVAVLREGALQQVAPPMDVYRRPANRFVAEFIGSPAMNVYEGELTRAGEGWRFEGRGFELPVDLPRGAAEGTVALGVRPPDVDLAPPINREPGMDVEVGVVEQVGSQQIVHATTRGGERLVAIAPVDLQVATDARLRVRIPGAAIHLFDAESGRRL